MRLTGLELFSKKPLPAIAYQVNWTLYFDHYLPLLSILYLFVYHFFYVFIRQN
jgi:hypothetical protein